MRKLSANRRQTTNRTETFNQEGQGTRSTFSATICLGEPQPAPRRSRRMSLVVIVLGGDNPKAHVDGVRRVRKQSHGNEIHSSLSVGPNIFQPNAAGTLDRNAP